MSTVVTLAAPRNVTPIAVSSMEPLLTPVAARVAPAPLVVICPYITYLLLPPLPGEVMRTFVESLDGASFAV
jgi:hypothetical protein